VLRLFLIVLNGRPAYVFQVVHLFSQLLLTTGLSRRGSITSCFLFVFPEMLSPVLSILRVPHRVPHGCVRGNFPSVSTNLLWGHPTQSALFVHAWSSSFYDLTHCIFFFPERSCPGGIFFFPFSPPPPSSPVLFDE